MNDALRLLQQRNSAPRLLEPAPDAAALENMFSAALRVPDHAWLRPWRFLVVEGQARAALGEVFLKALLHSNPDADATARNKVLQAPLRAPLLIVVICSYREHPKVPAHEQMLSTGCAAHALLLAAEAQGYAGVWRTGAFTEDAYVAQALNLAASEKIVGFLYFGSRDGAAKALPTREVDDYVKQWTSSSIE